jgi:hypothetical protein
MTARDRRAARDRRRAEAATLRCLYPSMTAQQVRQLLRHAEHVRLRDGAKLSSLLGR